MRNSKSLRLIRNTVLAVGVVACISILSQEASAQCPRGYGGGGINVGYGHGGFQSSYYRGGYNSGISINYNRGYSAYSRHTNFYTPTRHHLYRSPVWHDTSHYDYVPGINVRHGNHYHRIPGHLQYHRTGHWHH